MRAIYTLTFSLVLAGLLITVVPAAVRGDSHVPMPGMGGSCDGSGGMMNSAGKHSNDHCNHSVIISGDPVCSDMEGNPGPNCCGELAIGEPNTLPDQAVPGMAAKTILTKPRSVSEGAR
ncbi:MAG: hypothetical protein IEMM0002_0267 [bacterium]|nr:MAG: hypothetical protein IEMM0002_0267 [bacterium]